MFMVGVAMPFSFASRTARGETWTRMFGHALVRSVVLVALAVFLASNGSRYTQYSFVNVLGQIGLGYVFVFLLLGRRPAVQLAAAVAILVADWLLFALYPRAGSDFPFAKYGVKRPVDHHDRLLRPLEHECQRRRRLRPMVPQPVSSTARTTRSSSMRGATRLSISSRRWRP